MATNCDILKTQYIHTDRATQLDSLALNLTQIQLLAKSGTDESVAQHRVRESQFFIEWAVPSIDLETDVTCATELVDLQRSLSRWKLSWAELWAGESKRQEMATLAQQWCDRLGPVAFMGNLNCWQAQVPLHRAISAFGDRCQSFEAAQLNVVLALRDSPCYKLEGIAAGFANQGLQGFFCFASILNPVKPNLL
jgi:hypothetical protein